MAYRANQAFTTWVGGFKRRFNKNEVVPDSIAVKVLALTYDDGEQAEPKPAKRTAKKSVAQSTD